MPNLTLSIPEDMHQRIKKIPQMKWGEVAREAIEQKLALMEKIEKIAQKSKLTEKDVEEIGELVKKGAAERMRDYVARRGYKRFNGRLIKDGKTRWILKNFDVALLLPAVVLEELEKWKPLILEKAEVSDKEFDTLLRTLLQFITLVSKKALVTSYPRAEDLMKGIDPDDSPFIACALAYPGSVIWSDDKHMKLQKEVTVVTTDELLKLLKK